MNFGAGLVHIGISPGQDSFIGVYGLNCVEVSVPFNNNINLYVQLEVYVQG